MPPIMLKIESKNKFKVQQARHLGEIPATEDEHVDDLRDVAARDKITFTSLDKLKL